MQEGWSWAISGMGQKGSGKGSPEGEEYPGCRSRKQRVSSGQSGEFQMWSSPVGPLQREEWGLRRPGWRRDPRMAQATDPTVSHAAPALKALPPSKLRRAEGFLAASPSALPETPREPG